MKRRDEGSIFKHADGKRWIARLRYTDASGRHREKKRICPTHAQAKAEIADLRNEIASDASPKKTYRELDEFYRSEYVHAAKYVGGKKVSGFRQSKTIIENYLDAARDFFGDTDLADVTYARLREYKRHIEQRPKRHSGGTRSVADVNQHLRKLRRLLNVAVEQGWIDVSPFRRGGPLIIESFETSRTRVLTEAEEARLLAKCTGRREHIIPMIIFAVETAARRGEMSKLRWSDIDLTGRVIRIDASTTKTLSTRLAPITERLRNTLAGLRQNQLRPNSLVFGEHDFKRAFRGACHDAGLDDLNFHDLRHTAITRMLEKGIPQPLVMKISGHSQMKTFLRYVNQTETSVYDIAIQLDRRVA